MNGKIVNTDSLSPKELKILPEETIHICINGKRFEALETMDTLILYQLKEVHGELKKGTTTFGNLQTELRIRKLVDSERKREIDKMDTERATFRENLTNMVFENRKEIQVNRVDVKAELKSMSDKQDTQYKQYEEKLGKLETEVKTMIKASDKESKRRYENLEEKIPPKIVWYLILAGLLAGIVKGIFL